MLTLADTVAVIKIFTQVKCGNKGKSFSPYIPSAAGCSYQTLVRVTLSATQAMALTNN